MTYMYLYIYTYITVKKVASVSDPLPCLCQWKSCTSDIEMPREATQVPRQCSRSSLLLLCVALLSTKYSLKKVKRVRPGCCTVCHFSHTHSIMLSISLFIYTCTCTCSYTHCTFTACRTYLRFPPDVVKGCLARSPGEG